MTMWVFGYGSLLWNPGFAVARQELARLDGYVRSFCMRSIHHRGTPAHPGLVLALDAAPQGYCDGIALAVAEGSEEATIAYLRERELISSAYLERELDLTLNSGQTVRATTFVVDPAHAQYCAALDLETQAQTIATAQGGKGPNTEYLYNTAAQLHRLGLKDADMDWLCARVRELSP